MHRIASLPGFLLDRYHDWHVLGYAADRDRFRALAREGQHPPAMFISCCDSRVPVDSIFGPHAGEIFVHRNIANLVPRYVADGGHHGTAAAVEYAVTELHVAHLVVMGHSRCGGAKGCLDMCEGRAPHLERPESFVGRWLDELRPAHPSVAAIDDLDTRVQAFEKAGIQMSLRNLMGYPFVAEAVDAGQLSLHGLWIEIGDGGLETYDGAIEVFAPAPD